MAQVNQTNLLNMMVLCWKDDAALYFPDGATKTINCNNQVLGTFGVNIAGEVFPLPSTTITPPTVSGTDYDQKTALEPAGKEFGNPYPFAIGDVKFKVCTKVKDNITGITYYCDAADFAAQFRTLNPLPYQTGGCSIVSNLGVPSLGSTTATISWTGVNGATGIEWVNDETITNPTGNGTFLDASISSVSFTGLSSTTTYIFHIRTICAAGSSSAWTKVSYDTV